MKKDLVEWQLSEEGTGLVYPWYTHPFLEDLKHWHLKDRTVLELGGGRSTAWWRSRSKWVDTVEADPDWAVEVHKECYELSLFNGVVCSWPCEDMVITEKGSLLRAFPDGIPEKMPDYFAIIPERQYDIIVVDGIYRTEALQWALDHLGKRFGVIIADNWQQDFVWISPKAEQIMAPYEIHRFVQPGHTNHEGRPWNTSYWVINEPKK